MVNVWAMCLHFSSQTHPLILGIGKEFHVDMAQYMVKEECKSRMHFFLLVLLVVGDSTFSNITSDHINKTNWHVE
jgi:hypothetical protein